MIASRSVRRKFPEESKGAIKMFTAQKLKDLVDRKKYAGSIQEVTRLLATADQESFVLDRAMLRSSLSDMVKRILSQREESFTAGTLTSLIDRASSLSVLGAGQVSEAYKLVREGYGACSWEKGNGPALLEWEKAGLALWSASLWHGYPTGRFHKLCLNILSRETPRWSVAVRLAWCVLNDPVTKMDPALVSRMEGIINEHLVEKSLKELAEVANSKLYSSESSIVRKFALLAIAQRATSAAALKEDNRIPSQLLSAWTEQRSMPENEDLFGQALAQCVRTGVNPHLLLEAVSTLDLSRKVDMKVLRRTVFGKQTWKPSLEQLCSLSLSFSCLGFNDLEATSFLSHHLNEVLINRNPAYHAPAGEAGTAAEIWKIGVWYSFLTATAGETTTSAAFLDSYRELSKKIASGMWDDQGEFVVPKQGGGIAPNHRAIKSVLSQSLSSLGISNLHNVHLVNTPFSATLCLPDRDVVLILVDEKDVTSAGGFIGPIKTMKTILDAKGLKCKLLSVTHWEQLHASLSQDDFLASLLRLIQDSM